MSEDRCHSESRRVADSSAKGLRAVSSDQSALIVRRALALRQDVLVALSYSR